VATAWIVLFSSSSSVMMINGEDDMIVIEDFGLKDIKVWYPVNDPIVGGSSSSSIEVLLDDSMARFSGEVMSMTMGIDIVSPGFIGMTAEDSFPDVSMCEGIEIYGRSPTAYAGYRLSFGTEHADDMKYGRGYKAPFELPEYFAKVRLSFADFSDNWDEISGEIKVKCEDDNRYCLKMNTLKSMSIVSIWGEGVNGVVELELKSIKAYDCVTTDNDGDLFKRLVNIIGTPENSNKEDPDNDNNNNSSDLLSTIAISIAGVAIFTSLVAIFSVWRLKRNVATKSISSDPKPIVKATDSDNLIL